MKFKEHYLKEKFYKGIEVNLYGNKEYVEVFVNPTPNELKQINIPASGIRLGITDKKKPDVYAWHGNIVHKHMAKHVPFDFSFSYSSVFHPTEVRHDSNNWHYIPLKYKEEIKKKIKKILPKVKQIISYPDEVRVNI